MSWDPLLFLKQTNISSPKVVTKSVTGLYYSWNCSNLFWSDLVQTTSLKFCKIKRSNMSCWEAHVGFFRLFMKGIFVPYVPFDKKLFFKLVTRIRTRDYRVIVYFNGAPFNDLIQYILSFHFWIKQIRFDSGTWNS